MSRVMVGMPDDGERSEKLLPQRIVFANPSPESRTFLAVGVNERERLLF